MLAATLSALAIVPAPPSTIIVGGGPAGLAQAIGLAKRGWKGITVLDRLEPPASPDDEAVWSDTARHYLIGLGGRGQRALKAIGAWDDVVEPYCSTVVGRKDWAPGATEGIERIFTDRPYLTRVIPRARLVACLLRHVEAAYPGAIQVRHGIEVEEMRWEGLPSAPGELQPTERCVLICDPCAKEGGGDPDDPEPENSEDERELCTIVDEGGPFQLSAAFVVGADGSRRTVATAIEAEDAASQGWWPRRRFRVTRYKDTQVRVYKTIPLEFPPDWRKDINYSARTKTVSFDARPEPRRPSCPSRSKSYSGRAELASVDPRCSASDDSLARVERIHAGQLRRTSDPRRQVLRRAAHQARGRGEGAIASECFWVRPSVLSAVMSVVYHSVSRAGGAGPPGRGRRACLPRRDAAAVLAAHPRRGTARHRRQGALAAAKVPVSVRP